MNWWNDFASRMQCGVPLARLTWFRLGGAARYLFRPHDGDDLAAFAVRAAKENVPLKVLGAGANVLVRDDGFDGVVVRLDQPEFRSVTRHGNELECGAGVDLMPLTKWCSAEGLSGLEGMAGIPATVGGAVRMNAGGRDHEFSSVVRDVRVLGSDGAIETWSANRLGFAYRYSDLGDRIVLSARLGLAEDDPQRVRRKHDEYFEFKKRSQPLADKSAGCIFKNPNGQSAGALIDRAGLKGLSSGNARVSQRHANFIVAGAGATATDVLRLIDMIRDRVRQLFDTQLEVEIDIW